MTTREPTLLTLNDALISFVFVSAVLFGATTTLLVFDRLREFQAKALVEAVQVRGHHAANDLARSLDETWGTLNTIKSDIVLGDPRGLDGALVTIVGDGSRVSWAGFAGTDGRVVAASNGLLKGVDVSERPWFQRGLSGDFAGDVHEAVLLNNLLNGSETDPLRFIDLAAQVGDRDGQVRGVLGFHINFAWAEAFLAELAQDLNIDLFLVDQAGNVIVSTDTSMARLAHLSTLR